MGHAGQLARQRRIEEKLNAEWRRRFERYERELKSLKRRSTPVERTRTPAEKGPHLGFNTKPLCGVPAGAASVFYDEGECAACLVEADSMLEQEYIRIDEDGRLVDCCEPEPQPQGVLCFFVTVNGVRREVRVAQEEVRDESIYDTIRG